MSPRVSDPLRWRWRYRSTSSEASGGPIRARGRFLTDRDPDGDGFHEVLRIRGQRNGDRITGLVPAGTSIPGNEPYAGDNLVRYEPRRLPLGRAVEPQLTQSGIQFALADGTYSNVFHAGFLTPPTSLDFHSVPPFPQGATPPNSESPVVFRAWVVG
ncbi:MAG: hypothetical protein ACKO5F_08860 [Synechococcus sp.]